MNPLAVSPDNIWSYKQNKPRLICNDLESLYGVPPRDTQRILMARGVYKWLGARRDIIKLKNVWRDRLTELYNTVNTLKGKERHRAQGKIKAIEECRAELRAICHSERWRFPDNDTLPAFKATEDE
jgi:hypothetical protein